MLKSSTIRFITDTFGDALNFVDDQTPEPEEQTFSKQALLISKTPLDCTEKTAVSNFLIEGEAPTGTKRRLIFKIDDTLYKFDNNGQLIAYTGAGEFADVIQNGNQAGWLNSLSNITAFAGKKIYPIIALQAPYNAEEFPTIKVSLVTSTSTSSLTNTQTSPVYELADEAQTISEIIDSTTITGQATCEISVRLRNNSTNTDEETDNWSAYITLAQAAGKQADAVQFKVKSVVTTTDGTDSVEVKSIAVSHSAGEAIVSGSSARLFSTVQNYELDLQTCYVVVRHAPLVDAVIEAYVNFMELPKHRELITIGTATGSRQELTLGLDGNGDKNIVATSIRLYVDEVPLYNFDFSTEISTVILSANKGAVITASYDYDYGTEEWLEMTPRVPQPYNDNDGTYASRFFLNLSHANTIGKKISNVMIRLRRLSGSATENLGVATGKKQLFTLKHKAKPSTITFTNTVDFSYDEESGILALVAARGTVLNVAYNWQGKNITVRSFAAGWIPTAGYDYQEGDYEYSIAGGGSSDYVLPTMAPNVKGGAKLGTGLFMVGDTVNVDLCLAVGSSSIATEMERVLHWNNYALPKPADYETLEEYYAAWPDWFFGYTGGTGSEGWLCIPYPDLNNINLRIFGAGGLELLRYQNNRFVFPGDFDYLLEIYRAAGYPVDVEEGFIEDLRATYDSGSCGRLEEIYEEVLDGGLSNRTYLFLSTYFVDEQYIYRLPGEERPTPVHNADTSFLDNGTLTLRWTAYQPATSIGNIVLGNNLSLTGNTLNASGGSVELPLSNADRQLLDYLHQQFGSQIPT